MAPNLLEDDAEVLVNTTNAFGVMGAGLALAFARRWPEILPPYQADCRNGVLYGGACVLYDLPSDIFNASPRKWAAFCTKHHWRERRTTVVATLRWNSPRAVPGGAVGRATP